MDCMQFFPFENNIFSLYQSSNCFILPSRGEGLSNALLEAMSMELPVIATSVSGTTDVVENGSDGLLIQRDSAESLAAAMVNIISDPELAHRLGKNARQKVESRFSLEWVAQQYSDLYERLS
jgi:glycosyltransferase involved in cell wall biosynthesis